MKSHNVKENICKANLLEWLKLKPATIPSVGEDVKELELWYTAGGNVKSDVHFGNHAVCFVKG